MCPIDCLTRFEGKIGIGREPGDTHLDVQGRAVVGGIDFCLGVYDNRYQGPQDGDGRDGRALVHADWPGKLYEGGNEKDRDFLYVNFNNDFDDGVIMDSDVYPRKSVSINTFRSRGMLNVNGTAYINGKIMAKEVYCTADPTQDNFPDYVFSKDYKLKSLGSVNNYIRQHKHLPGIPSKEQVKKDSGISLGKMNNPLLQKVEELTLYTIQQEKHIKKLKKQEKLIEELEARLKALEEKGSE